MEQEPEHMHVLVVGGRSGLGRVVAEHLHAQGATVSVASRRARPDLPLPAGIGEIDADATDPASIADCIRTVAPDHVVATCADVIRKPLTGLSADEARRSFETKFWGQYNVAQAALAQLPAHGSLVLFSGIAAQLHFPELGLGGVINAAVERLALELAAAGRIRVNCVSPGVVRMPPGFGGHKRPDAFMARLDDRLPGGRTVSAGDVAMLVRHLIVNQGANGTIARLDAGYQAISGLSV